MHQVQVDVEQRRSAGLLGDTWLSQTFSMMVRGFMVMIASNYCVAYFGRGGRRAVRLQVRRDPA